MLNLAPTPNENTTLKEGGIIVLITFILYLIYIFIIWWRNHGVMNPQDIKIMIVRLAGN